MTAATKLYTIEEYSQIPDPPGGRYELHRGEVVLMSFPGIRHKLLQARLRALLQRAGGPAWHVQEEFPYSIRQETDVRAADVAFVARDRVRSTVKWLEGSPELVIEVLSPSNTASEMAEKADLCLAHGAIEFWMVDPDRGVIRVEDRRGPARTYAAGQAAPLDAILGSGSIAVNDVFADEEPADD
jgi:Uma2 family endonuclease